jgi:uncharacterized protein YeaO (DUF488 family)
LAEFGRQDSAEVTIDRGEPMSAPGKKIMIKRAYDPIGDDDGTRVLVDRVWPRGVTKEAAALTLWLKDIAPSTQLRKWFGHDPARWREFGRRHRAELDRNPAAVEQLRALSDTGRVTLIYAAHDLAHNNAVVLKDYIDERLSAAGGRRSG